MSADALENDFALESDHENDELASEVVEIKSSNNGTTAGSKRKRQITDEERRKKKEKKRIKKKDDRGYGDSPDIGMKPPSIQADFVASKQRTILSHMSSLELDPIILKESSFIDSTSFLHPRDGDHLHSFLKLVNIVESKKSGRPSVVILSPSAVHITDLVRSLKKAKLTNNDIPKLFAKHIKIEQQQEWLRKFPCTIAIGTPNRVLKLLGQHLKTDALKCVVVDTAFRDAKQRSIWDMPECVKDLVDIIGHEAIDWNKVKMLMF